MAIPTLSDIYNGIISDLNSKLGIVISIFGKNFSRAMAAVQAAKMWLIYRNIAKVQKNIFVDTADRESSGGTLERFGRVKLNRDPFLATAGIYEIEVTGTIGGVVPANTVFKSNDDASSPSKLYVTDSEFTLAGSSVLVTVRALEVGLDSRLVAGDKMTLTSPLVNVDSEATVDSEITIPLAAEDIEDYREKVMIAFRIESQGGSRGDYILWSLDTQGVRKVYPYAISGAVNEMNLYVEANVDDSGPTFPGQPTAQMLLDVEEVIERDPDTTLELYERSRRPVGMIIHFLEPSPKYIDIEITDLFDDSASVKTIIENAVIALLHDVRPFIDGADDPNNMNKWLYISNLVGAVNSAIGQSNNFSALTFTVDSAPATSYEFINGNIPILNSITYV